MDPAPTDSHNIATVKAFLKAQFAGEAERGFHDYASPSFNWTVASRDSPDLTAAIPWAGFTLKGAEGYKNLMDLLFGEFEPLEFKPSAFYDAKEVVFVMGTLAFKHRKTEKIARSDFVSRFDIFEGKVGGGQMYEDTYAFASARK